MSVVSCQPSAEKRRTVLKDGNVQHVVPYKIVTDDPLDGTIVAYQADGLPQEGDVLLNDNSGAVCTQVEVNPVQGYTKVFEALVTFQTGDPLASTLNPLDRPPTWSFPGTNNTQPIFLDKSTNGPNGTGVPIVNSAGDTFSEQPQIEVAALQINMGRNEATWNIIAMDTIANTSNRDAVYLDGQPYAPGTLRLGLPTAAKTSEVWQGEVVTYYKVSYVFHASKDTWALTILDTGYNELVSVPANTANGPDANPTATIPIVDKANTRVTHAYPLDGQGHAKQSPTDPPATLNFVSYPPADWSSLRLA
jgi:hypothetical protein